MRKKRAGAIGFLLGMAGCAPLPTAFHEGPEGARQIDQGQIFGVSIGMDRRTARDVLLKRISAHFIYSEKCRDWPASHVMCDGATETDHYRVDGVFDTGSMDVYVRDDKVVRIRWAAVHKEIS